MPNHQRILCINCNICMNKMRRLRVLELDSRVISIVCEWISPIIVTEGDNICEKCFQSALQAVNLRLKNEPETLTSRTISHACFLCGRSLLNRQKMMIIRKEPTELHISMHKEIEKRTAPRQISVTDSICIPCHLKIRKYVLREQETTGHTISNVDPIYTAKLTENQEHSMVQESSVGQELSIDKKESVVREPVEDKLTISLELSNQEFVLKDIKQESDVEVPYQESDVEVPDQESDVKVPDQESDVKVPDQESDVKVPDQVSDLEVPEQVSDLEVSDLEVSDRESDLEVSDRESDLEISDRESELEVSDPESNLEVSDPESEQDVFMDTEPSMDEDLFTDKKSTPDTITLFNYRRAANTAIHCVFHGCRNRKLKRISDALRATIVHNHKYYIPKFARVCAEHLLQNNWEQLYDSQNSLSGFTADQIEHMISLGTTNRTKFLDFLNIESINDNLFKYGMKSMKKHDFDSLLNEMPRNKDMPISILGLGALIIKMRTGNSNDRLSQLLQVPRSSLERYMDKVKLKTKKRTKVRRRQRS